MLDSSSFKLHCKARCCNDVVQFQVPFDLSVCSVVFVFFTRSIRQICFFHPHDKFVASKVDKTIFFVPILFLPAFGD